MDFFFWLQVLQVGNIPRVCLIKMQMGIPYAF